MGITIKYNQNMPTRCMSGSRLYRYRILYAVKETFKEKLTLVGGLIIIIIIKNYKTHYLFMLHIMFIEILSIVDINLSKSLF